MSFRTFTDWTYSSGRGIERVHLSVLFVLAQSMLFVAVVSGAFQGGNTYYVDCSASENGNGSESSPWNRLLYPNSHQFEGGDVLLFMRGTTCEGTLHPKGSGNSDRSVTISAYGEGPLPVIDGDGNANSVYLENQSYWIISNLYVTNATNPGTNRRGIYVVADNQRINYIVIEDNVVQDVWGDGTKDAYGSAGILVETRGDNGYADLVYIRRNEVRNVDRTGITTAVNSMTRRSITNLVISENYVENTGGDGIVPIGTPGAVVEYNTVRRAASRPYGHNAGIWTFNSNDVVIQYNEVFETQKLDDNLDGQAYDLDWNQERTIIQYNYSHNNVGGFLLVCGSPSPGPVDSVARYNLSVNDRGTIFRFCGPDDNTLIHNNTIVIGEGLETDMIQYDSWGGYSTTARLVDNLFFNDSSYAARFNQDGQGRGIFDSNIYSGPFDAIPPDPNAIVGDNATYRNQIQIP
ncbi:MAG: right-handed parallel beta-helix repeat-containing protein [Chloroflexota bacterium]